MVSMRWHSPSLRICNFCLLGYELIVADTSPAPAMALARPHLRVAAMDDAVEADIDATEKSVLSQFEISAVGWRGF
jgi:hypothetical protein